MSRQKPTSEEERLRVQLGFDSVGEMLDWMKLPIDPNLARQEFQYPFDDEPELDQTLPPKPA